ncbi:MAG TPA: (2Fe-2S)-binding protein [Acidobacteria bacterium]|nr:(2Fe-2S)-binding protein [Acidobacteriota bacterium]
MARKMEIVVNGDRFTVEVEPEMPLLWVLRDVLGLAGTKYGCGIGECGACTVLLDGEEVRSCVTTVAEAAGRRITTIEGLAHTRFAVLQEAWIAEEVPQCGYCQPGQLMAAAALLAKNPHPDDEEIAAHMSGILCRCGTYQRIRRAIRRAADAGKGGSS